MQGFGRFDRALAASRALAVASIFALGFATVAPAQAPTASIDGRVSLDLTGAGLAALHPIVVYLDPIGAPVTPPPSSAPVRIVQKDARFSPAFRAVARGQTISMPNMDAIYHNVFSSSYPNDFDLGIYASGESRSVKLEHAGVVKTYCSIHESMNGTIFVSPSPWFATVGPSGSFSLTNVPPGRYALKSWCEKLPDTTVEIQLEPGQTLEVTVDLLGSAG